eukprot:11482205-Heterocapsa_arctica.AAC.1
MFKRITKNNVNGVLQCPKTFKDGTSTTGCLHVNEKQLVVLSLLGCPYSGANEPDGWHESGLVECDFKHWLARERAVQL